MCVCVFRQFGRTDPVPPWLTTQQNCRIYEDLGNEREFGTACASALPPKWLEVQRPKMSPERPFFFFRKIEATLALHATGLSVLGHLGIAFRRTMLGLGYPGLGHRIEELFVTSLLMIWHLEFAIGPPTLSNVIRYSKLF